MFEKVDRAELGIEARHSVRGFYDGDARLLRSSDECRPHVFRPEIANDRVKACLYGFEIFFAVVYRPIVEKRARGVPYRVNDGIMT